MLVQIMFSPEDCIDYTYLNTWGLTNSILDIYKLWSSLCLLEKWRTMVNLILIWAWIDVPSHSNRIFHYAVSVMIHSKWAQLVDCFRYLLMSADQQRIVDLNVGGVLYTTSVETLTKVRQIIGWKEIKKIKYPLFW